MRIGLDFDDVIGHSHALKAIVARERFGVIIPSGRYRREFVVEAGILTEKEFLSVSRDVYLGKYPMDEVRGAAENIKHLVAQGHSVRIVTNRSHEHATLAPALVWLKERSIDVPVTGIAYGKSKAPACAGLDVFVDDNPDVLRHLVGIVPHLLFFAWEHNAHEKEPDGAIRVHSWREIMFCISRINQRRER